MKIFLILIFFCIFLSNTLIADETLSKQKELENKIKILEKELEIEKLKKELAEQKKADEDSQKQNSTKKTVINKNDKKEEDKKSNDIDDLEKEILEQVKLLGKFEEPKNYPSGFKEMFLKKGCKTWNCLSKKTSIEMSKIFKSSEEYNLKNPGNQIRGMALYEIFYLNTLKKNEQKINKFLENWPKKNKNSKNVIRMIKLNKSREKMRSALGMDLNTSVEDAIEVYWLMSEFLDLGITKEKEISKDLKLRKKYLTEYKQIVSKFSSEFKKNKDQYLYDAIKKKRNE